MLTRNNFDSTRVKAISEFNSTRYNSQPQTLNKMASKKFDLTLKRSSNIFCLSQIASNAYTFYEFLPSFIPAPVNFIFTIYRPVCNCFMKKYLQGSQYPKYKECIYSLHTIQSSLYIHCLHILANSMICQLPNPRKQKAWTILLILDTSSAYTFKQYI